MKSFRAHGADGADEWGEALSPSSSVSTACGSAHSDGELPSISSVSRACSDGAERPLLWTLIWCQECCHKQECKLERTVINDTAHDMGASLVCFKKAAKFAKCMEQFSQSSYGLLTDWKEAKPCLEAAEACPPSARRPAFVVIYCQPPKCRDRATSWAVARPPGAIPVRILPDLNLLEICLNGLMLQIDADAKDGQQQIKAMLISVMPDHYDD